MALKIIKPGNAQHIKMAIYGLPGVGKTWLAATAPSPLFIDAEGGGSKFVPNKDIDVVPVKSFQDMNDVYFELTSGKHNYKSVVIDSLSELRKKSMDTIVADNYKADPKKNDPDMPTLRSYGKNTEQLRKLVRAFRDLDMHVIFTCLLTKDKDETTGAVTNRPELTPALSSDVCGFVDIVGCLKIVHSENGDNRMLLTQPTTDYIAKDRSGKLDKIIQNPNLTEIIKQITGGS